MPKLGSIEFDTRILEALGDDRLVIFAGAGVSMGDPANLASFWKLASDIAQGTGFEPTEPLDRFLGQLDHRQIDVHEIASRLLSPAGSAPNALHYDLLRLFRSAENVRLVTTNFDLHFQAAADEVFDRPPDVYRAPALPRGYDFNGIVHVHGALPYPRDLVLTDADFGRAYLTEGWARRFLVDVFRHYSVLFVGYSHDDVVMNYLARALPADGVADRFALTDENEKWDLLGITPIRFVKGKGADAFEELYDGVHRLAERASRGALDWQTSLAELAERAPPEDEEAIGEIEQALQKKHTTRFFLSVARDPAWLHWLDDRKHLSAMFGSAELSEKGSLLAHWFAENFSIEHPHAAFKIIAAHDLRLSPSLWRLLGRELGVKEEKEIQNAALTRWVALLLASEPKNANDHVLLWLAERCAKQGLTKSTVKIFLAMIKHRLEIKTNLSWLNEENSEQRRSLNAECTLQSDHWTLNEVWSKHLTPNLSEIAQPLLFGVLRQLESMHDDLVAWDMASCEWDPLSFRRSAIEPHEQDSYPGAIDVLIDAGRGTLEWFSANSPALLEAWIETLARSDVPLLRRLAVHCITVRPSRSPEENLGWLVENVGLHEVALHHEVYRAVALNYSDANEESRWAIVETVVAQTLPSTDNHSSETRTARLHFDWLCWLRQAKPDCAIADTELAPIRKEYPDWAPSNHPDLTHWMGSTEVVGPQSPWSVDQLRSQEAGGQLDALLDYRGNIFDGPDRQGLLLAIREACKQDPSWGFALTSALVARASWQSDLWSVSIAGLKESDLSVEMWSELLTVASNPELIASRSQDVADLLYEIVKDGGKAVAVDLLERANAVALQAWEALEEDPPDEVVHDWLTLALSRPAGVIVQFWIHGLALQLDGKRGAERSLPENYRQWFMRVLRDETLQGGMGRSILASQAAFLFNLDESWTAEQIIPLLNSEDELKFVQMWSGFLGSGRLYQGLSDALMPSFIRALPNFPAQLDGQRRRFIEFYASLAVFYVSDPREQLLPVLFQDGSPGDRIVFASQISSVIRRMQPDAKYRLWESWLHRYWEDRLVGVPAALEARENQKMLEWIPYLEDAFPEAARLAARGPVIEMQGSFLPSELRKTHLVALYPNEAAELLIYLCKCDIDHHLNYVREAAARVQDLPRDLRRRLDEALAQAG